MSAFRRVPKFLDVIRCLRCQIIKRNIVTCFTQDSPRLQNEFSGDLPLQKYLKRNVPQEVLHEVLPDLEQFGEKVAGEINELGRECELYPPKLNVHDAWGNRINDLWTCPAWKQQHDISAREGLIAIAYERKYQEWSRLYQMLKLYLYSPSSGFHSCPLAMTDGAAKSIEVLNYQEQVFKSAFSHLTSRDPKQFWSSGQWMTEKRGGSDVASGTETTAIPQADGTYKLYGYKWFSSATDANIALTLARIADENGNTVEGTKGLTMFLLETHNSDGSLNNFDMIRLKDKLGTRQLPTAELSLNGSIAHKMGHEGRGVPSISSMLTITRIHNSAGAIAGMRRILHLARDYSHRRKAFGLKLVEHPLHMQTLFRMEVERRGALLLFLQVAQWLGLSDCKKASEEHELLLRLMTPIIKLYTAKQVGIANDLATAVGSEGLEAFGGQGYMEDTGLPCLYRDAQVLPIWEGTTNILSLDVLRCLYKTNGQALVAVSTNIQQRLKFVEKHKELRSSAQLVKSSLKAVLEFAQNNPEKLEVAARDFSYSLARIYIGSLLLEVAAQEENSKSDIAVALRWCHGQDLAPVISNHQKEAYKKDNLQEEYHVVMDGYKL